MKFVKAKDPIVVDLNEEKLKMEEKKNVVNQRMLNPRNQSVGRSESRAKSRPRLQRGPRATYVSLLRTSRAYSTKLSKAESNE